jgi:hypothetical protein
MYLPDPPQPIMATRSMPRDGSGRPSARSAHVGPAQRLVAELRAATGRTGSTRPAKARQVGPIPLAGSGDPASGGPVGGPIVRTAPRRARPAPRSLWRSRGRRRLGRRPGWTGARPYLKTVATLARHGSGGRRRRPLCRLAEGAAREPLPGSSRTAHRRARRLNTCLKAPARGAVARSTPTFASSAGSSA